MVGAGYFIHEESGIRVVSDFSITTLELVILIINIIGISNYITFTCWHYFRERFC